MAKNKFLPTKDDVIEYIKENPEHSTKRHIAKAFGIKGDDRVFLKQILKELKAEGHITKRRKSGTTTIVQNNKEDVPDRVIGIFNAKKRGGVVIPADTKIPYMFKIFPEDAEKLNHEDLALIELDAKNPFSGFAKVIHCYGNYLSVKALPLIAVIKQGIPFEFSEKVKRSAQNLTLVTMKDRKDLTDIPFVTIDGETAKDFDDAVFAEPDNNPNNKGGWHLIVAIADIAWYVRPQTPLDYEARERGNSVYFQGGVIPMLPKEISNDLCSLKQDENRPCLAVHMWIDAEGNKIKHKFERVMIKSQARLTYKEVQAMIDSELTERTAPLYNAYLSLSRARQARETLDLDIIELQAVIDDKGIIQGIEPEIRYESNKLIEEFMVLANVCAAEELEKYDFPIMFRIHEMPSAEKRHHLFDFLKTLRINIPTGKSFVASFYNQIIESVKETPFANLVQQMVLRCQSQAKYSPKNLGHFGLSLPKYVHFTSPIRRYADLLVHRALISALDLGEGGLSNQDIKAFEETAQNISVSERKAMSVERETMDRFTAVYMMDKIDKYFIGTVNGVTTAGLFITLEETGAEGLIPMRSLPGGRYELDEKAECLRGDKIFRLGDDLDVVLKEANPVTGHLLFNLSDADFKSSYSMEGIFKT